MSGDTSGAAAALLLCDALANNFHLGLDWRCCLVAAAAVALTCFAQFSQNDSDNLYHIMYVMDEVGPDVEYIRGSVAGIQTDVNSLRFTVEDGFNSEHSFLRGISNKLSKLTFDLDHSLQVHDSKSENLLTQVADNTLSLDRKFDLFLDAYTNRQFQASGIDITNLIYQLTPRTVFDTEDLQQQFADMQDVLENDPFLFYWEFFGSWRNIPMDLVAKIDPYSLPRELYTPYRRVLSQLYDGFSSTTRDNIQAVSLPYNYFYGTRTLTDTTIGISNNVASLQAALTNVYDSGYVVKTTSSTGTSSGFSSGFVGLVGDLSTSSYSTGMVDTNIATVATNDITKVANNDYSSGLNFVSAAVSDTTKIEMVSSILAQNFTPFEDLINNGSATSSYTFDLGTLSFFGVEKHIEFTFNRPPEKWFFYCRFFFRCIELVCILSTISAVYNYLTLEAVK